MYFISGEQGKNVFSFRLIPRWPCCNTCSEFIASKIWFIRRKSCSQLSCYIELSFHIDCACSGVDFVCVRIDSMRNHFDSKEIKNGYQIGIDVSWSHSRLPKSSACMASSRRPFMAMTLHDNAEQRKIHTMFFCPAKMTVKIIELLSVTRWQARESINKAHWTRQTNGRKKCVKRKIWK